MFSSERTTDSTPQYDTCVLLSGYARERLSEQHLCPLGRTRIVHTVTGGLVLDADPQAVPTLSAQFRQIPPFSAVILTRLKDFKHLAQTTNLVARGTVHDVFQ